MRTITLLHYVLPISMLMPLSACGLSGGSLHGRVFEEGTRSPVAEAIVVVKWTGSIPAFAHSQTVCVHVLSTTTDQKGRYRTPAWSKPSAVGLVMHLEPSVIAYKVGYEFPSTPSDSEDIVLLKPFSGTVGERFAYLDSVISNTNCGGAGSSYKNLYWITNALYEEAKAIARSIDEKRHADRLKGLASDTLVNEDKPTKYDEHGRFVNVDPRDSFKPEDLK